MPRESFGHHDDAAVYVISVAAELTGLHPQTLRQYDRLGLVSPGRASGRGRRYSAREIELLREVARLSADGVSLVGIKRILELEAHIDALQRQIVALQHGVTTGAASPAPNRGSVDPSRGRGAPVDVQMGRDVVPVGRDVVPVREETTLVVWSRRAHP